MNLRMYFFVPYNISEIQKGIQAGHCALEYAKEYGSTTLYKDFIENYKTWIILNAGTTRDFNYSTGDCGDINSIEITLMENEIHHASFREPDLNFALSAVCFIADERVWDFETYPEYQEWIVNSGGLPAMLLDPNGLYNDWVEFIGGDKNRILRDLIRGKKLA